MYDRSNCTHIRLKRNCSCIYKFNVNLHSTWFLGKMWNLVACNWIIIQIHMAFNNHVDVRRLCSLLSIIICANCYQTNFMSVAECEMNSMQRRFYKYCTDISWKIVSCISRTFGNDYRNGQFSPNFLALRRKYDIRNRRAYTRAAYVLAAVITVEMHQQNNGIQVNCYFFSLNRNKEQKCPLPHCGLVTPYDDIDLDTHWLR